MDDEPPISWKTQLEITRGRATVRWREFMEKYPPIKREKVRRNGELAWVISIWRAGEMIAFEISDEEMLEFDTIATKLLLLIG